MAPEQVLLYRAPSTICNVDEIGSWLESQTDATVEIHDRFLDLYVDEDVPTAFARARVQSPFMRETGSAMYGIIRYEERILVEPGRGGGVLYDGIAIQRELNRLLPSSEQPLATPHVVVLDRHLATWGEHDGRWHKRIAILGQPTILSVPGVAEAPAKPESYYTLKQQYALAHGDSPPRELLEAAIDEDVIVPADPRTTDLLKGYALAGIHLLATGEAFCENPACRLYNGHRHNEVLRAQLEKPEFCDNHSAEYRTAEQ